MAEYRAFDRPAALPERASQVRVKVSLSKQLAYVLEGDSPLLIMPVSVGKAESPTPTGNFRILSKQHKRRAYSHGYLYPREMTPPITAEWVKIKELPEEKLPEDHIFIGTPMSYWCEFADGYGFHTGWVKPYPCSTGCVRMHENVAPKFFRIVRKGTPVNIAHHQPEDNTIGIDIPRSPNADPLPGYPQSLKMSDQIFYNHKPATFAPWYNITPPEEKKKRFYFF